MTFSFISDNPILRRDALPRRMRSMGTGSLLLLMGSSIVALTFFILAAAKYVAPLDREIFILLPAIWGIATLWIIPAISARTIAQERVLGTWNDLLLSRLRPREIILGKLGAALAPHWLLGMAILPGVALVLINTSLTYNMPAMMHKFNELVCFYIFIYTVSFVLAMIGIYCSLRCTSVIKAQILSYAYQLLIIFFFYLFFLIPCDLTQIQTFHRSEFMLPAILLVSAVLISGFGLAMLAYCISNFDAVEARHRQ
jgi:ABC-type transport system involved in multi-copper enzyme maturation permease subunit